MAIVVTKPYPYRPFQVCYNVAFQDSQWAALPGTMRGRRCPQIHGDAIPDQPGVDTFTIATPSKILEKINGTLGARNYSGVFGGPPENYAGLVILDYEPFNPDSNHLTYGKGKAPFADVKAALIAGVQAFKTALPKAIVGIWGPPTSPNNEPDPPDGPGGTKIYTAAQWGDTGLWDEVDFICPHIYTSGNVSGTHSGSSGAATLTTATSLGPDNSLVGGTVMNSYGVTSPIVSTPYAWGKIIANTSTTITATLQGGTRGTNPNAWESGDNFRVYRFRYTQEGTANRRIAEAQLIGKPVIPMMFGCGPSPWYFHLPEQSCANYARMCKETGCFGIAYWNAASFNKIDIPSGDYIPKWQSQLDAMMKYDDHRYSDEGIGGEIIGTGARLRKWVFPEAPIPWDDAATPPDHWPSGT